MLRPAQAAKPCARQVPFILWPIPVPVVLPAARGYVAETKRTSARKDHRGSRHGRSTASGHEITRSGGAVAGHGPDCRAIPAPGGRIPAAPGRRRAGRPGLPRHVRPPQYRQGLHGDDGPDDEQSGQAGRGPGQSLARLYAALAVHGPAHGRQWRRADDPAQGRGSPLQRFGLAGEPALRFHQAILSAERPLDAGHRAATSTGSTPRRRRRSISIRASSSMPWRRAISS